MKPDMWQQPGVAVHGSGPADADVVLLGEQPAVRENRLLGEALTDAGIPIGSTCQADAVKPRDGDDGRFTVIRPKIIVVMGPAPGQALFGPTFRVGGARGVLAEWHPEPDMSAFIPVLPTVHPSEVMRDPDPDTAYGAFVADLRVAARTIRMIARIS